MREYVPFMKLKQGEILGLGEIAPSLQADLIPFFDIARGKTGITPEKMRKHIQSSCHQFNKYCSKIKGLYIDDFDLASESPSGLPTCYEVALREISSGLVIPVVGPDRSTARNKIALDFGRRLPSDASTVTIRVQLFDLQVEVVTGRLQNLVDICASVFRNIHLVVDCRVVDSTTQRQFDSVLSTVGARLRGFSRVIVAGSIVTASIRDLSEPSQDKTLQRYEIDLYRSALRVLSPSVEVYFGDYGVVSPDYSDVDIMPGVFRKVTAPKVIYSFGNFHHLRRGASLERGGNVQYRSIFREIIAHAGHFFRGAPYSWGDQFMVDKANGAGKEVTPASVIKPTTNAHLTFMLKDFVI